jgi:hypothetical protein
MGFFYTLKRDRLLYMMQEVFWLGYNHVLKKLLFAHLVALNLEKNTHMFCLLSCSDQLLNDVLVYLEAYFQLPTL